jgi:putative endonuclease
VQYWCGDGQAILRLHPRKPLPGTLYVGVTNDLSRRIGEHRSGLVAGFTKKYKVHQLVYYEEFGSILEARARERTIKRWRREWKFKLIEDVNPRWRDLTASLISL